MGGMKFEYDESGAKFVYFAISFYAMIIIPATYYLWPKAEKKKSHHSEDLSCFEPCIIKNRLLTQNEPKKRVSKLIKKVLLIVGWIVFFYLVYKASQIEIEHKEYDPFVILGVDREATEKEIKKQYRELSKVMHPDKGGDPEKFKELTTAYKALTDEEARNNWMNYGNPDGPGVTNFGIALPKWIVEGKNSYLVLAAYVIVFMVIMPIIVGLWWYKSIKYTGDQVLMNTSKLYNYFIMKNSQMLMKRVIMILSASLEFEKGSNPEIRERPTDNIEVPKLMKDLPDFQDKMREAPFSYGYCVKARALIHAHLLRIPLNPETLLKDKNTIIKKCPFLINEMINSLGSILMAVNSNYVPRNVHAPTLDSMENMMKLSPMIVQALSNKVKKSELLQLPHIEESQLRHFATKKRNIFTIKQFVTMKDADRRSVLRYLSDEQYEDIMRVCSSYPNIDMNVEFKIIDDENEQLITAGAVVTLIVTLKRTNLETLFDKEDMLNSKNENLDANEQETNEKEGDEMANGEAVEKDEAKENKTARKPWEKQKKKAKTGKAKNKPKPKNQNNKSKNETSSANASTNKEEAKHEESDKEDGSDKGDESESDNENETNEEKHLTNETSPKKTNEPENLGTLSSNKKNENDEEDDEYFEKFQEMQKQKEKLETKTKLSHRVYCPFFPDIKQECWWIYVADKKRNAIISAPLYICTLRDTDKFELKFLAPKTPGTFTYSVCLRSDSYVDFDVIQNIKLTVMPAKSIEEHPQWNFTDEEEDKKENEVDEFTTESESDE